MDKLQLVKKKIGGMSWGIAAVVALVADMLDYAIIGAIPIYGDIFDVIVIGILYKLIGPIAMFGIIELIPVAGDFVPTYLIIVVVAWLYKGPSKLK